ncbi:hypothetical protein HMPREF1121_01733 [Porphyromonas sp. KLE 1280]|nr:hypothetical protein HMPREF1121_01733 [Porphyromonas sp. KLE 1280]
MPHPSLHRALLRHSKRNGSKWNGSKQQAHGIIITLYKTKWV